MNATRYWLGRARGINREIDTLLNAKQETRDQLLRITQNYDSDGAQSTKNPHKYDRLVELENLLDQKVDELLAVKAEITEAINKLEDGRQRCVLLSYYVRCKTQEEIAVELRYSYRQVKRLLRAGIAEIEKMALYVPIEM
jgi:DNA-directed RNA polymerase specialized sigma subunit